MVLSSLSSLNKHINTIGKLVRYQNSQRIGPTSWNRKKTLPVPGKRTEG